MVGMGPPGMATGTPVVGTGTPGVEMEPPEVGAGTYGVRTGTPRDGDSTSRVGMGIIRVGVEPLVCKENVQGGDRILWNWDRDLQQGDGTPRDGDRHPLVQPSRVGVRHPRWEQGPSGG